ncbi:MAG: alanine racemase [Erysipelotrichaceae bacterium]
MFIDQTLKLNRNLIAACFSLHQNGLILPDSYVVDVDRFLANSKMILDKAGENNLACYFMLKQIGRNPYLAAKLIEMGYKGAVVVDFKEALVMMKHHIHISNVGHLVQIPKALLQKLVDYGCDYYTVFSYQKILDLNQCAKKSNKKIKLMLRVTDDSDIVYSGQTAGFYLHQLEELVNQVKKLEYVEIKGVTSFPCFLYDETLGKIAPTNNLNTVLKAKELLEALGEKIDNVNAPSTSSVATIEAMQNYPINSIEPGHGLSGTTPLHASKKCQEVPAVAYVSEVSHNYDGLAYCYGGGHYRRSHVKNALVGKSIDDFKKVTVIAPNDDSIDYHFGLSEKCQENDTVIMAFRYQIFVTRSNVVLLSGLSGNNPKKEGIYNSLGDEIKDE